MSDVRFAGTGHRPSKLGGYGIEVERKLLDIATDALVVHSPVEVISGMALGWDTALALSALALNIPLTCMVPFSGQECMWPPASQRRYGDILRRATTVIVTSPGGYSAQKMQVRNIAMVDRCTHVLALWDGSSGGTGNCIKYAQLVRRPIINLWNNFA